MGVQTRRGAVRKMTVKCDFPRVAARSVNTLISMSVFTLRAASRRTTSSTEIRTVERHTALIGREESRDHAR